jgi:hypothetical protein
MQEFSVTDIDAAVLEVGTEFFSSTLLDDSELGRLL